MGIGKIGKKKVISEEEISTLMTPATIDVRGIAVRLKNQIASENGLDAK